MTQTEHTIRKMLTEIAGVPSDVSADGDLYLELGVASVHAMQLLLRLEEHFGVTVPDQDFIEAPSVAKLTAMIERLRRDE